MTDTPEVVQAVYDELCIVADLLDDYWDLPSEVLYLAALKLAARHGPPIPITYD